ncbi:hypothetical protein D3C76_835760 [compost metagenome]
MNSGQRLQRLGVQPLCLLGVGFKFSLNVAFEILKPALGLFIQGLLAKGAASLVMGDWERVLWIWRGRESPCCLPHGSPSGDSDPVQFRHVYFGALDGSLSFLISGLPEFS